MEQIENFKIIGITIETSNVNGKSTDDLGILWERFYSENLLQQIPNKISNEISLKNCMNKDLDLR